MLGPDNSYIPFGLLMLFVIVCILQYLHSSIVKALKKLIKIHKQRALELEQNFESLLKDKKEESRRRKEAEDKLRLALKNNTDADVKKLEEKLQATEEVLFDCRAVLELVGRLGTVENDFWYGYCLKTYERIVKAYVNSVAEGVRSLVEMQIRTKQITLDDETLRAIKDNDAYVDEALKKVFNTVINDTVILKTIVDEMFLMADDFYTRRDEYFISAGPVPTALVDKDFIDGKIFKNLLNDIFKKEKLPKELCQVFELHIVNILLFPLSSMQRSINLNEMEKIIGNTAYIVFDIKKRDSNDQFNFTIPVGARSQLNTHVKGYTKNIVNKNLF